MSEEAELSPVRWLRFLCNSLVIYSRKLHKIAKKLVKSPEL